MILCSLFLLLLPERLTHGQLWTQWRLSGRTWTRSRLRHAVEVLGGVSKKETKRMEKEYQNLIAQES